jgi:beta-phosphoglucomutase
MATFPRPLAAAIFDLDGVLVDTAKAHYRAWKRLADQLGIPFEEQANEALKGVDRMRSLELVLSPSGRRLPHEELLALAERKNTWYREEVARLTPADLFRGARDVLLALRAAGLRIALASASKNAPLLLDRLGLIGVFDIVIDPACIANGKPAPDIFLAAAQAISTSPDNCLGIEDSIAGIQAIKSAGMWALGIGDPAILTQADCVLPHISAFKLSDFVAPAAEVTHVH